MPQDQYHSENVSSSNSPVGNKDSKTGSLLKKRSNQFQGNLAAKTPKTDCQDMPVSAPCHHDHMGSSIHSSNDAS